MESTILLAMLLICPGLILDLDSMPALIYSSSEKSGEVVGDVAKKGADVVKGFGKGFSKELEETVLVCRLNLKSFYVPGGSKRFSNLHKMIQ